MYNIDGQFQNARSKAYTEEELINLLIYADDIVLCCDSREDLRFALESLYLACKVQSSTSAKSCMFVCKDVYCHHYCFIFSWTNWFGKRYIVFIGKAFD